MTMLVRALVLAGLAVAASVHAEPPALTDAWVRATPPGARTAAAYLTIANAGEADRLLGATTPAARSVEVHAHTTEGGMQRMVRLPELALPAGETVRLVPGGPHLMLIDITGPLAAGAHVTLSLQFAAAGTHVVEAPVIDARGDAAPAPHTP